MVASRTSSFRFRDADTDARDIGRLLNVAAIMEGSVRKAGKRVRVTAQLIDAGSGYHLWSENFDRALDVEGLFALLWPEVRGLYHASFYVHAEEETCLERRHSNGFLRHSHNIVTLGHI